MKAGLVLWILLASMMFGPLRTTAAQLGPADREAVAAAHGRWFAGLLGSYDMLSDVLAPEVSLRFPGGNQMERTRFLSLLQTKEVVYDSADHHATEIRVYGDAGVVTGTSTLQLRIRGTAISERLAYTAVYVRSNSKWTLVAWQSTLVKQ